LYHTGDTVAQDYKTALRWFLLAAQQGDAYAQTAAGGMYVNGIGTQQDDKAAAKWFTLAANQGLPDAQYRLGILYHNGQGVPKDRVQAFMWLDVAASGGNADAAKLRDDTARLMTSIQIQEATRLAAVRKSGSTDGKQVR
jgi:TPR repeat protein